MKLLKVQVDGHTFFERDHFEMTFIATDRVSDEWEVYPLYGSIYTKTIMALCGVNASGKTAALEVLRAVTHIFINGASIRHFMDMNRYREQVQFSLHLIHEGRIYELTSTVMKEGQKWKFGEEVLKSKPQSRGKSRTSIFLFSEDDLVMRRSTEDTRFLPDDISMMTSLLKTSETEAFDHMQYTEQNVLAVMGDIPEKFTQLLDPSIEYIRNDQRQDGHICIKFMGREEITIDQDDLQLYLSSGTVKGLNFLGFGFLALQTGGYFIVDEIENHFHKAIVEILLGFFADPSVNVHGAALIFSTHYVEILESLERKDHIYITRKNQSGITIGHLSNENVRNDMKKSDLFLTNKLKGTAPSYDRYIALKEQVKRGLKSS